MDRSNAVKTTDGGEARGPDPKAVAWDVLIGPLIELGLRKQRRHTAEQHGEMLERVARKVSYLERAQLEALRDVVARHANGPKRNTWPDEVSVLNWAALLAPPPDRDSRLVVTYMASSAGRRALGEGVEVAVALRQHLKRTGRPPGDYDWKSIRNKAAAWAEHRQRLELDHARGVLGSEDAAWLRDFGEIAAKVRRLVEQGETDEA